MKTQGEEGYLQAKERGLRKAQPCHTDLGLPASRIVEKCISVISTTHSVVNLLQQPEQSNAKVDGDILTSVRYTGSSHSRTQQMAMIEKTDTQLGDNHSRGS